MLKKWKIFTLILFLIILPAFSIADTEEEIKAKIADTQAKKAQIEKEIAEYEVQLKDISAQSTSLSNAIKTLDATINKNSLNIKLTQNNIDETNYNIENLSQDISDDVKIIDKNSEAIAELLRETSESSDSTFIETLLMYKSISEFWNEQENISRLQNSLREKVVDTKNTKEKLEDNKVEAEAKKKELISLKADLVDKKKVLDISKKDKVTLLTQTKNQEANYTKILADKKAQAAAFDKELLGFESGLHYLIDPNSYPHSGKGILSWPLSLVRITQVFGVTDFSTKTNIYNGKGHNGVDFGAAIGTKVKAVLSGVVEGTGDTDPVCPGASNGKWVLIRHDNGLSSIYVHLSLIKAVPGQKVSTGDVIALSGYSGYVYPPGPAGAHLHLGLFISEGVKIQSYSFKSCAGKKATMPVADLRAYLDPLVYL